MEWYTSAVRSALAATFGTAARLRRGRPFHPSGLIFDAHLRLHGAPNRWGAAFLDQRIDLRGVARLSRSIGVPAPLPDILGLAFRWQDDDATADLLLATTGRTTLGRRLLRPTTQWTGLYTSLFPYQADGRRLLLGALLHTPTPLPAALDAVARSSLNSSLPPRRVRGSSSARSNCLGRRSGTRTCGSTPSATPSRIYVRQDG
jgi:hypothetical protein